MIDAEEGVFGRRARVRKIDPHIELERESAGKVLADGIKVDGGDTRGRVFVHGKVKAFSGAVCRMRRRWDGRGRKDGGIVKAESGGKVEPGRRGAIKNLETISRARSGNNAWAGVLVEIL